MITTTTEKPRLMSDEVADSDQMTSNVQTDSTLSLETTICQLEPTQHGIVVRIQGESTLRQQLLEMGFTRGTEIEFVRRAPLGDPIDVKLRGYRLSLREREACAIVVATEPLEKRPTLLDKFRK